MTKPSIETCLSPALFDYYLNKDAIVVVIDILRATSSICNAFANGVKSIIPVENREEARLMKQNGYIVAAERDGFKLDFADFGNSPFNFSKEHVEGKDIVYSTTNGTRTIHKASCCHEVIIGSFLNVSAIVQHLKNEKRDIILLCAGWKNKYNIEDTVFAGSIAQNLIQSADFTTKCDATTTAIDMWQRWQHDIRGLIEKTAQRWRLHDKGLDDCIDFCLTTDITAIVPVFKTDKIIAIR